MDKKMSSNSREQGQLKEDMLACHYDSMPGSFGLSMMVLDLLPFSKSCSPENRKMTKQVIFLATEVKSWALWEPRHLFPITLASEVKHVINLEAKGTSGPATMFGNQPWQVRPY